MQELVYVERGLKRVYEYILIQEQLIDMIKKQLIDDATTAGSDGLLGKAQMLLARLQKVQAIDMDRRDRLLRELDLK